MYLHLFASETAISDTLLRLLEQNIDLHEHYIVFGLGKSHPNQRNYEGQLIDRIFHLKDIRNICKIISLIKKAQWIYFHFLAYDPTLFYWFLNRKRLHTSTWIIWGADVYAFQKSNNSFRTKLYELVRKKIIPDFPEVASLVKEDYEVVRRVYNTNPHYIPIIYPAPVNSDLMNSLPLKKPQNTYKILIGNSADQSNKHLEILNLLRKFRNEKIKIFCPLSYGGTIEYIKKVNLEGSQIFDEKFTVIKEMMNPAKYADFLSEMDIVVMNHDRQQGLGNIMASLFLGKKVYLRSDTTSFHFLTQNGCKIESVSDLKNAKFSDLINFTDVLSINRSIMEEMLSEEYAMKRWEELFKRHQSDKCN